MQRQNLPQRLASWKVLVFTSCKNGHLLIYTYKAIKIICSSSITFIPDNNFMTPGNIPLDKGKIVK